MTTASYGELVESTLEVLHRHPAKTTKNGNQVLRSEIICEDVLTINLCATVPIDGYTSDEIKPQLDGIDVKDVGTVGLAHRIGSTIAEIALVVREVKLGDRDTYIAYFKGHLDSLVN